LALAQLVIGLIIGGYRDLRAETRWKRGEF
jgi:hypothetical protein